MIVNLHGPRDIRALVGHWLGEDGALSLWYGGGVHVARDGIEIICRPWAGWWRCLARGTRPALAPLTGGDPEALISVEGLAPWEVLRAEALSGGPRSGPGGEVGSVERLLAPWRACAALVGARVVLLRAEGGAELLRDLPLPARVDMLAIERLPGGGSIAPLRSAPHEPDPGPCSLASELLAREVRGDWVLFLPRD